MTVDQKVENVVVIGSGPAGWTAALYTARATLEPVVITGTSPNMPGGQLMMTSDVENYPGFPKGILGPELMGLFQAQAERFGAKVVNQNVVSVDFSKRPYAIHCEDGSSVFARSVIISTGANAKLIGIAREKELMAMGAGVSACATCDGAFYKGLPVAVVGGGDSAMEEALFLTRFASSVTLIHRRDEFRASKIMVERVKSNPAIRLELGKVVEELIVQPKPPMGRDSLIAVRLKDTQTGAMSELEVEGLFVAIGHQPNTELFGKWLQLDAKGYIVTEGRSSKTKLPGVFACGDVQDSVYRQAITAAGSGCMAAIDAERDLEAGGY